MTDRTLEDVEDVDQLIRPSFEMQEAAIKAGFTSVRDYVLAQCVAEIRVLKGRVDKLEAAAWDAQNPYPDTIVDHSLDA